MGWSLKRHFMITFVGIAVLFAAYFLFILSYLTLRSNSLSSSNPALLLGSSTPLLTTGSHSCPKDFCGNWILGSCIGKKERYKERECYDYPEKGLDYSWCEANKGIYYDKGSQLDETC